MATGRYIVQHHQIPSTTLFTYTVPDSTWIYPPFSGVIFYLLYLVGGYSGLSLFSALACTATVALAAWRGGRVTAALAILAVPAIAFRIVRRADLFTTVLFAAVLVLLARYYEGHPVRLWPLPVLMLLWVNLHHGFVAGLALMGAYVFSEVCDLLFVDRRVASLARLRKALPWLFAAAAATLVNPSRFSWCAIAPKTLNCFPVWPSAATRRSSPLRPRLLETPGARAPSVLIS